MFYDIRYSRVYTHTETVVDRDEDFSPVIFLWTSVRLDNETEGVESVTEQGVSTGVLVSDHGCYAL